VLSPKNWTYNSSSISLIFTLNEPVGWMGYSLDGKATVTVAGNSTISGLASGLHSVTVYANDSSGNTGTSETFTFTVEIPQEPFPWLPVVAVSVVVAVVVAVAAVVYLKKRRGVVKNI
jgi:hypothetical protein